jgi:hypothetical protein
MEAYGIIMGKMNGLDPVNEHVLIMEHLAGDEYVVDCVSKDGVHKCVAVGKYRLEVVDLLRMRCCKGQF